MKLNTVTFANVLKQNIEFYLVVVPQRSRRPVISLSAGVVEHATNLSGFDVLMRGINA